MSLVGQVVDGRYRVQSHLADGGMASVYVAVDLRLEGDVALKIKPPDLAGDENFVSEPSGPGLGSFRFRGRRVAPWLRGGPAQRSWDISRMTSSDEFLLFHGF